MMYEIFKEFILRVIYGFVRIKECFRVFYSNLGCFCKLVRLKSILENMESIFFFLLVVLFFFEIVKL